MQGIIYGLLMSLLSAHALAGSGAEGTWKTESGEDGGYLEVTMGPCAGDADKTCGVISKAHNGEGIHTEYEHLGKIMVKDMESAGDNTFTGGTIWDPEADKTYKSKMQANGDHLRVDGCIAFFCSGQNWTRVN
jgi:uncharacterized protein (DUF2147 family)